ncbi:MAG TPA: response regulator, partial [Thermoguttaceae bacterium]|nr:response regulator [Thermoguttaceae bacterium]
MLGISGIELQERLQELDISLPVVVMTAYAQIGMTVRAMRAGAVTLLEKPCEENELWDAIRAALAQNAKQRETQSRCRELQQRIDGLSPLHRNIMDWIVAGRSNKWIAEQLELVLRTVET